MPCRWGKTKPDFDVYDSDYEPESDSSKEHKQPEVVQPCDFVCVLVCVCVCVCVCV